MKRNRRCFIMLAGFLFLTVVALSTACGVATPPANQVPKIPEMIRTSNVEILDKYEIPVNIGNVGRTIGVTVFYDKTRDVTCLLTLNWYGDEISDLECFEGKRDTSLR